MKKQQLVGQMLRPGMPPENIQFIVEERFNTSITKIKRLRTDRASTTTLANDPDLAGFRLRAGSMYTIEGVFRYIQDVGDLKWVFEISQTVQSDFMGWAVTDSAGVNRTDMTTNLTLEKSITTMTDGAPCVLTMSGGIKAHATLDSYMNFQWAQNTSSANDTTIFGLSWIRLTEATSE